MKKKFDENTDTLIKNLLENVLDISKMKSKLRQGRFDKFIYLIINLFYRSLNLYCNTLRFH